jgi:branched-chain amino acid transport system ATP-binding protein
MLRLEAIHAGYSAVQVLHGVSIAVETGAFVSMVGPNGAGKTTLFKTISGIVVPSAGRIEFEGIDLLRIAPAKRAHLGIAHIPEGRQVFPSLTVMENLEMGAYTEAGRRDWQRNIERIFAWLPVLAERRAQLAGTLSGGEQQMLAIGRGLMSEPRLLILDEPSLGLSPLLVEEMFTLIGRLNRDGLAILLVEQNVVQSLAIAHRAYVLENGRIALSGAAAELAEHPELRKSYLGH